MRYIHAYSFPLVLLSLMLISCSESTGTGADATPTSKQTVTLYTSVDDTFARMVVDAFEAETGIRVRVLGDTEATKTTGLVARLQAESGNPTADVWWSSEPMGTIALARAGVLEAGGMAGAVDDDWPEALRGEDWSWVGNAVRARVIGYASDRVDDPPTTMAQLAQARFKGRIGMARPQFGTTRIHMAILADRWGMENFGAWLGAMRANGVRLYDGNATIVRALSLGEIDIGLTDTDDIWSGQANGWKVDLVYEGPTDPASSDDPRWPSAGPTLIPNTVAIIKDAPHRDAAHKLAAYLASAEVERMLWESTTHNTPIHPELRSEFADRVLDITNLPDYRGAAEIAPRAMDACERVLEGP